MLSFYPEIKLIHVAAVFMSGALFFLRGVVLHFGGQRAMAAPVRHLSYAIDTILLTAAVMLTIMLHQYPFVHGWLTMKVVLLAVYIVLGSYALKRGHTKRVRVICWVAALAVYAFIISVARTHDPAGIFLGSG